MKLRLGACGAVLVALMLVSAAVPSRAQMPEPPPPAMAMQVGGAMTAVAPGHGPNVFYMRSFHFEDDKVVTGAPYSAQAVTETTQVLADGNRIDRKEQSQVYRDGRGRTRREMTLNNIGPWSSTSGAVQMINIFDPVAGARYMLNVQEKKAFKMPPLPDKGMAMKPPVPPPGAVTFMAKGAEFGTPTTVSLGTQEIEGVEAQGTRTTETIPSGKIGNERPIVITDERWYSPDLQVDVLVKHSDPRMGEVVYQLTNIIREEPDASLFQVPADYTVESGPMVVRKRLQ